MKREKNGNMMTFSRKPQNNQQENRLNLNKIK